MERTVSNSSIAAVHDIICKRGDSFKRQFRYWTDAAKTVPMDITADSFSIQVLDNRNKKPLLTFTLDDDLSIVDPNILIAEKTPTQMLLPTGNYKYDIQKTLAGDGSVVTIMKGTFTIEDDITV